MKNTEKIDRLHPSKMCYSSSAELIPGGAIVHEGVHDEGKDQFGDGGRRLKRLLGEAGRDPRIAERPQARVVEVVGEEVLEHRARGREDLHHSELRIYVVGGGGGVLEAGQTRLHDGRDSVHPLRILCHHLQQGTSVLYRNLTDVGLKRESNFLKSARLFWGEIEFPPHQNFVAAVLFQSSSLEHRRRSANSRGKFLDEAIMAVIELLDFRQLLF